MSVALVIFFKFQVAVPSNEDNQIIGGEFSEM